MKTTMITTIFFRLLFCFSLSLIGQVAVAQSMTGEWNKFLRVQNTKNYCALAESLYRCQNSECVQEIAPDSVILSKLLRLVEQSNPMAVDLTFSSIQFLDGGNLEDAMRSLSALNDGSPEIFLEQSKKHALPDRQINSLLRMLPLDSVDDISKKKLIVDRRIRALSTVDNSSLIHLRDSAISKLRLMYIELGE